MQWYRPRWDELKYLFPPYDKICETKLDAAECRINQLFACFFKYIFYLHQFKKFFRNCKAANRSSTSETNKKKYKCQYHYAISFTTSKHTTKRNKAQQKFQWNRSFKSIVVPINLRMTDCLAGWLAGWLGAQNKKQPLLFCILLSHFVVSIKHNCFLHSMDLGCSQIIFMTFYTLRSRRLFASDGRERTNKRTWQILHLTMCFTFSLFLHKFSINFVYCLGLPHALAAAMHNLH